MSGRWWRAYSRARHDPKLLRLSDKHFRWWFNLVCVAADNGGVLPSHADLAVEFRVSGKTMTETLDALIAAGLFDHDETGIRPHNWNGLQYKSDVSTTRVKRFREQRRNVSETASESEAETEQISEAKASGAKAPAREVIFQELLPWLNKRSGKDCRSFVGKLLSEVRDDDAVRLTLEAAEQENPVDPVGWIAKQFKPRESWNDRRIREAEAAIDKALAS